MTSLKAVALLLALAALAVTGCGGDTQPTNKPVANSGTGGENPQTAIGDAARENAAELNRKTD